MRLHDARAFMAVMLLGLAGSFAAAAPQSPSPSFDIASSLDSRIGGKVPASTMKSYTDTGRGVLTTHVPTAEERRKVVAALAALTPLQRAIAQKHLRSITFANGMVSNAQTTRSTFGDGYAEFEIVLNPIILKETASQFLTRKERQLFDTADSSLSVSVDGGSMDAVVYVLLHEATHMTDMLLGLTPQNFFRDIPEAGHTPFTRGVWRGVSQAAEPYRSVLLESVAWPPNRKTIPIGQAKALYEGLGKTPFVSVYASKGCFDDLAELAAWRQMVQKLKQPYRIEIRDGARIVYSYEPMKSPLVQSRFGLLDRFDSPTIE